MEAYCKVLPYINNSYNMCDCWKGCSVWACDLTKLTGSDAY